MSRKSSATTAILGAGVLLVVVMMCLAGCGGLVTVIAAVTIGGVELTGPANPSARERDPSLEVVEINLGVQPRRGADGRRRDKPNILPATVSSPRHVQPAIEAAQCDDLADGGPVGGPDCVTAEIRCDSTIIGHTVGGVQRYDSEFYEQKYCWPQTMDHDGGDERVYRLTVPGGDYRAWVTLHSPCADLDLAAFRQDGARRCPTIRNTIKQCEMRPEEGTRSERLELTSQTRNGNEATWFIVVEGVEQEEGAFSLHVQCAPGLGGGI